MSLRVPLLVSILSLLLAALFIGLRSPFRAAAQTQTLTFKPVADTYVNSALPSSPFGTSTTLRVDGSPVVNSYLRFTVAGLSGQAVSRAMLKVYANSAASQSLAVKAVANNTWTEATLTYNTAPALGNTLASVSSVAAGTWVTWDVTSYVKGEATYSLGLTTAGVTAVSLSSRESGSNSPQLVLTLGASSASPTITQTTLTRTPTSSPTWIDVSGTPTRTPAQTPTAPVTSYYLLLAGDICRYDAGGTDYTANCKKTGDLIRSALALHPGAQVQTLGDNVNNQPTPASYDAEYANVYAPNWGSFLNVTHAALGNHDILPPGGSTPYFSYFGAAAGAQPGGYYSYNIGSSWHVIVLDSECSQVGGCGPGSTEYNWLNNDLTSNIRSCVMAVWHEPRWTSGQFGDSSAYGPWWDLLYQNKADIVVNGHNHNYERFHRINPSEQATLDGIRAFIVGTGGAPGPTYTYADHPLDPNEVIRNQSALYGVLQLTLNSSSYSWEFLPVPGYTFSDSGTTACH